MYKTPRGTKDILPIESPKWQYVESKFKDVCKLYNYKEIRTPMFESTELFCRGVGETTDVVGKEMYTFTDRKGRSLTLRPEGTAAVMRAFVEHKLFAQNEFTKLFYIGSMFRYERPQKGRWREFEQFGIEAIGSENPSIDAEVIALGKQYLNMVGLKQFKASINTLGDAESRNNYKAALTKYFTPHVDGLCPDCKKRLESNPLRILDCKVDKNKDVLKNAPKASDYLNDKSKKYFSDVRKKLDFLNIDYIVDETLVRGLDYYNHTVFEFIATSENIGANSTIFGGGRYNGLVSQLGGPDLGGVGFALGVDRLILALEIEGSEIEVDESIDVFVVSNSDETSNLALEVIQKLRLRGFSCEKDHLGKKFKTQMKNLNKYNPKCVLIIGDDELSKKTVQVKMDILNSQIEVEIDKLENYLLDKLNREK